VRIQISGANEASVPVELTIDDGIGNEEESKEDQIDG
jgi:hypothetical protein